MVIPSVRTTTTTTTTTMTIFEHENFFPKKAIFDVDDDRPNNKNVNKMYLLSPNK